jgi:hypothetical protein
MGVPISTATIPSLETQVVRHPKKPAVQVMAAFATLQMLEKRQKYFLNYFLAVGHLQAQAGQITQQRLPEPIEEFGNLLFQGIFARSRDTWTRSRYELE